MHVVHRSSFRRLVDAFGRSLTWHSSGFLSRTHELSADHDLFARVQWLGLRRSAIAETDHAHWKLRAKGAFGRDALLLDADSGATIATVQRSIRKERIDFDGISYAIRRTGFFRIESAVTDPQGNVLLRTGFHFPFRGRRGWTRIEAPGAGCVHLAELVLISWFLAVRDTARQS